MVEEPERRAAGRRGRLAAARAEQAAEARALREDAGAAQPEIEPTPEVIHQPTVEYTPFQTDEHTVPLGEPRDDEPRLVAARGLPERARGRHPRVRRGAASGDQGEHDAVFETGEQLPPEEPPAGGAAAQGPGPPAGGRRGAAPSRAQSAPPAPAQDAKTPKGPRRGGGAHWGRRIFTLIVVLLVRGRPVRVQQDVPAVPRGRQRLGGRSRSPRTRTRATSRSCSPPRASSTPRASSSSTPRSAASAATSAPAATRSSRA